MAALENKMAALSFPPKFAVRGRFVHANARRAGLIEFVDDGLIVVEDGVVTCVSGEDYERCLTRLREPGRG